MNQPQQIPQTVDELMSQRGQTVPGEQTPTHSDLARATAEELEHRVLPCPPVRIRFGDGDQDVREYQRRRPTLPELEQLQVKHAQLTERLDRGERPTKQVLQSVFEFVMPAEEAARFLDVEDFDTVVEIAARVGRLGGRTE